MTCNIPTFKLFPVLANQPDRLPRGALTRLSYHRDIDTNSKQALSARFPAKMKVILVPYNPEWPDKFSEIREQLLTILKDVPIISVEHVGSTSIPGMKAKPVLDIDIIIPASSLDAARRTLSNAGYTDCGEMDIPGRFAFRQPRYGRLDAAHGMGSPSKLRRNTYVVIEGCLALRNHLDVKRVLLEDQELREEYARVKTNMQDVEFEHIGQYVAGKTEVLCKILRKAGWSEEDLEPVIRANSSSK